MKKISSKLLVAALIMAFGFSACDQPITNSSKKEKIPDNIKQQAKEMMAKRGQPIPGQYIVVFKEHKIDGQKVAFKRTMSALTRTYNIQPKAIEHTYQYSVSGFAAELSDQQRARLKQDKRVDYIAKDRIVMLSPPRATSSFWCIFFPSLPFCSDDGGGSGQVVPWGITRVGGPVDGSNFTSKAWIIDTGIDLDHPDLNVNVQLSAEFLPNSNTADDGNGHGTHVAGTIAAIDNNIDVVGIAAGATVVAVRVLNSGGSGSLSGVIAGIDYVAANAAPGDVANLSLGAQGTFQALNDAIRNLADQGVYVAIAAGNAANHAEGYSPAQVDYNNVWTVSAIDSNDNFAYFSNYGNPPVDFAGPGVDVKSLWLNGGTNTISGTSMASPHMAGVLLVTDGNPSSDGNAIGDPDGNADPIVHL